MDVPAVVWVLTVVGVVGLLMFDFFFHVRKAPFINDGRPVPVVEISTGLSLSVILGLLVVTVIASLVSTKGKAQNAVAAARRHAIAYLDVETDPPSARTSSADCSPRKPRSPRSRRNTEHGSAIRNN